MLKIRLKLINFCVIAETLTEIDLLATTESILHGIRKAYKTPTDYYSLCRLGIITVCQREILR